MIETLIRVIMPFTFIYLYLEEYFQNTLSACSYRFVPCLLSGFQIVQKWLKTYFDRFWFLQLQLKGTVYIIMKHSIVMMPRL